MSLSSGCKPGLSMPSRGCTRPLHHVERAWGSVAMTVSNNGQAHC